MTVPMPAPTSVELRWMTPSDADVAAVVEAGALFDEPPTAARTRSFLEGPGHHLALAFDGEAAVGFASGIETPHPDKPTEMCLYELGVDDTHRRRGIGRALVEALAERARAGGCAGMWVLTEDENTAALATYRSARASEESRHVMLAWSFDSSAG